jgi:aminoglycoside 2''-phosphotransferase
MQARSSARRLKSNMSELTLSEIEKAILRSCPEWTINSIRYLGEGDFCSAYLVNDEWVFRFAKHEKARASLKRECCLLPKIAHRITLSIPSPQSAFLEDETNPSFVIYPLLCGDALSQEKYLTLDDAARTRCAEQIAQFLNQLHSTDITLAESCGVLVNAYEKQYSELLTRARENLFSILDEPERVFIERVIEDYLASNGVMDFRPALLHGDFSPGHVIFDERAQRISAIIDFGDVMIGDPAWDFLWIYEDYCLDFLSRVLSAYCEYDKPALLKRVFQFSKLSIIDWTASCQEKGGSDFEEAIRLLREMRIQEQARFMQLMSADARSALGAPPLCQSGRLGNGSD